MLPIDINQRTIVPLYPEQNNISSASEAVDMEDLLTEILLRLPVKSLLRFKCVSKHWDSLISSPHFTNLRYPDPCSVSGLFYHPTNLNFLVWDDNKKTANPDLEFVPLQSDKDQSDASRFESITRIPNLSSVIILNSCHGLSLCLGYNQEEREGGYHVLNPTTKQFATLPDPHLDGLEGLFLAYDPSISPHYKVVSVWNDHVLTSTNPNQWESYFQIEIYSSETKSWRASGEKFTVGPHHMTFQGGVFWNGAINWWSYANPLYFNIEEERLGTMSMTPIPPGKFWYDALHLYYGESRGHLHFAEIYSPTNKFDIYEMKKDYSEWFVKYHVDLTEIATNYPEMALVRENWYCSYAVLSIIRGEDDDDDSFLVLHIPGKFIRYNLVDKCFKTIYEYEGYWLSRNGCYEMKTYPHIESLSSV